MRSVHPDAFQGALTPIPRNRVVWVRNVPNDGRAAMKGYGERKQGRKEMFPNFKSRKSYIGSVFTVFIHNRAISAGISGFELFLHSQIELPKAERANCFYSGLIRVFYVAKWPSDPKGVKSLDRWWGCAGLAWSDQTFDFRSWTGAWLIARGISLNRSRKITLGISACLLPAALFIAKAPLGMAFLEPISFFLILLMVPKISPLRIASN